MTDETEPKAADRPKPPMLTRKDLFDRVQKATGAKVGDLRHIVDATLTVMRDALKAGENLHIPPFGATRVLRAADAEKGAAMRVLIRDLKMREPSSDRPARPERPAKVAGKGGGGGKKVALAAKGEAE